jgi:hypothetical protein
MEEHMQRFVEDFTAHLSADKQMNVTIDRILATLDKNTEALCEHMRRTEIAEINLTRVEAETKELDGRMKPLEGAYLEREVKYKLWKRLGIVAGALASVASAIYTVASLAGWLK